MQSAILPCGRVKLPPLHLLWAQGLVIVLVFGKAGYDQQQLQKVGCTLLNIGVLNI